MKQANNARNSRGRGSQRKQNKQNNSGNSRNDNKVRGNPKQLLEKYKTQAREAMQAGDRIAAENFFQFADHYQRVLNEMRGNQQSRQNDNRQNGSDKAAADDERENTDDPRQEERRSRRRGRGRKTGDAPVEEAAGSVETPSEDDGGTGSDNSSVADTGADDAEDTKTLETADAVEEPVKKPRRARRKKASDDEANDGGEAAA